MKHRPLQLESVAAAHSGLRVVFNWQGDRFGHQVEWFGPAGTVPLLATCEGTGTEAWPASPPWQQAHLDLSSPVRPLLLALGMAGKSHWSASIEAPVGGTLFFDIACRAAERPEQLGSTYTLLRPGEGTAAGEFVWHFAQGECRLQSAAHDSQTTPPRLRVTANTVAYVPAPGQVNWPGTIRWQYRLVVLPHGNTGSG